MTHLSKFLIRPVYAKITGCEHNDAALAPVYASSHRTILSASNYGYFRKGSRKGNNRRKWIYGYLDARLKTQWNGDDFQRLPPVW